MGRAQFEYDEVGNTFYYVLVSFYAVVLIPLSHFLWPSISRVPVREDGCQCEGDKIKRLRRDAIKPWESRKRVLKAIVLLVLWALFAMLAYKVSQIEVVSEEYDPFKILGLDPGASVSDIKKKYHTLSKQYHPDRGGDEEKFNALAKAYQALTNEESRENWEKYGNPDGPRATTFGIALPKWIVSEHYGNWVLAFYGLVFMVFLPVAVGIWWYNSMKYSTDKVLFESSKLFAHFISKTPNMEVPRALMVLTGSFEFWRKFNSEIVESEDDNVELPILMKEFHNLGENKKEVPFCQPYSVKARILLYSYLSRIDVGSERLLRDQIYMVSRVLPLLDEFLRILLQFTFQIQIRHRPTLNTLENVLKLYPMFVQGLWPKNSVLLQLPHLTEQSIAYLRRNKVYSPQDLVVLPEHKRRALLNSLDDSEYDDVLTVLNMMPKLEIQSSIEVQGEDDHETVTVGSVVTIRVTLKRYPLLDLEARDEEIAISAKKPEVVEPENKQVNVKRKPWEKQKPKKKGAKNKKAKAQLKKKPGESEDKKENEEATKEENDNVSSDGSAASDAESDSSEHSYDSEKPLEEPGDSDEDDWDEDVPAKKDNLLESEPTNHHEVHCPHYPHEKHEWWFLYLIEKRTRTLVSMVVPCKTLDREKTTELRISAPEAKGIYNFVLHVRSDSYMDFDYTHDIKMEVQNAREPPQVIVYDSSDEEEELDDVTDSSEEYTEGSASEADD